MHRPFKPRRFKMKTRQRNGVWRNVEAANTQLQIALLFLSGFLLRPFERGRAVGVGKDENAKSRKRPGARDSPIAAASIQIVPLPQNISQNALSDLHTDSNTIAAARVSFKGAAPTRLRQPRLCRAVPVVSISSRQVSAYMLARILYSAPVSGRTAFLFPPHKETAIAFSLSTARRLHRTKRFSPTLRPPLSVHLAAEFLSNRRRGFFEKLVEGAARESRRLDVYFVRRSEKHICTGDVVQTAVKKIFRFRRERAQIQAR